MTISKDRKVALVTGGGSGLGAFISTHLAEKGFSLVIHYHSSRESAEKTRETVMAGNGEAIIARADISQARQAESLAAIVEEEYGRLDVLVNNAGAYHQKGFYDLTEEEWALELNSTATAVYFTTRGCLPLLRQRRGRVINIGDSNCEKPASRRFAPAYHIGKTGVLILTRSFAKFEAEHGVAVNMISPGLLDNSVGLPEPETIPAGRFGTPDDIKAAIDLLIAAESSYLTGSNLQVGGGWNL